MRTSAFTLCIPTFNPGGGAKKMTQSILNQTLKPSTILIIDSSSTDGSIEAFKALSPKIIKIDKSNFDHGGTRNLAFDYSQDEFVIFLTQDAILASPMSLEIILNSINTNSACGLVYGRQLPAFGASAYAAHARIFNYPEADSIQIKSEADIPRLGIKTAFCSNSFAIYRRSSMEKINYFQTQTLFAEDAIAAAKLIKAGFTIGYEPNATVFHSHNYTLKEEFRRYFDVGAFHAKNAWFLDYLGKAEGEGLRFVISEYEYLKSFHKSLPMVRVVIRNGIRFLAYKAGRHYKKLPNFLISIFTMNKRYWVK